MKRDKSAAVGLVVCFVVMIATVGAVTFRNYKKESEDKLAKTEEENKISSEQEEEPSQITQGDNIQAEITTPVTPDVPINEDTTPSTPKRLSFSPSDTLIWPVDGNVVISLKNISRDELNIDAEELMERFVRGDISRNTEGSGLGLNIAKSLMELQKGELQLLVDGDLFKVTLIFPGA